MPDLTSKQRADLRGRAHALKPIVHIGKEGVTPSAIRSLQQAFDTHDLIKVRVLETAPEGARATASALAEGVQDASVVQTVGRNATLYRPLPEPKAPPTPKPTPPNTSRADASKKTRSKVRTPKTKPSKAKGSSRGPRAKKA
jgi:RNA-binding protein